MILLAALFAASSALAEELNVFLTPKYDIKSDGSETTLGLEIAGKDGDVFTLVRPKLTLPTSGSKSQGVFEVSALDVLSSSPWALSVDYERILNKTPQSGPSIRSRMFSLSLSGTASFKDYYEYDAITLVEDGFAAAGTVKGMWNLYTKNGSEALRSPQIALEVGYGSVFEDPTLIVVDPTEQEPYIKAEERIVGAPEADWAFSGFIGLIHDTGLNTLPIRRGLRASVAFSGADGVTTRGEYWVYFFPTPSKNLTVSGKGLSNARLGLGPYVQWDDDGRDFGGLIEAKIGQRVGHQF